MLMPMMSIGKVWVDVLERLVHMDVRVGLLPAPLVRMRVLMVFIMDMRVIVFNGLMSMRVGVLFLQMQPEAGRHE